ncbi:hypothetical protein ASC63_03215 [Leifsonia sp. Root112D2]|nr:hypothetical protein ASC63_03215 [Leifsonia sp. Root112D2]
MAYAFGGVCDSTLTAKTANGVLAAAGYADAMMTRYIVENGAIRDDLLSRTQLQDWVDGLDPLTGERRGYDLESPVADLVLDATINAPKSFSIAAMLDGELNVAYEDLQDRLRDRIIKLWQTELNARRGKGGSIREDLARVEVVELKHERSRSLDPHKHRHLWLNVKVKGVDGKWSNVDTRVALRFQNVINAEGDLASRTDPAWITALAAKGFTLNSQGEIEQLEKLVRPLSKRSAQIEANKAVRTQWWKSQYSGQEPSRDVLNQIDRWAWAQGRPNKPGELDEDVWQNTIVTEIAAVDSTVANQNRAPVRPTPVALSAVDRELVAAKAVVDADRRSTGTGGRFSVFDVRAGVLRALAASGVMAEREDLADLVDTLTDAAISTHTVNLLDETDSPQHVKRLMATSTAIAKVSLARQLEAMPDTGAGLAEAKIERLAKIIEPDRMLDSGQRLGAAAIAGTQPLVTISGAAGAGKTTMLKVASAALRGGGRQMIIVAPTKKASSVAGRETDSKASSLHQLLHEYGWRWNANTAGQPVWTRLNIGETDPISGITYSGPRHTRLRSGDRIVVDEAGMLELEAANALVTLARQTGTGIAVVGDEYQAMPVGHSGAMAAMKRRSGTYVELTNIHRFKDADWAKLTLELRNANGAEAAWMVANKLISTTHVELSSDSESAEKLMVDHWFETTGKSETIALVTATNEQAQTVSEAIQRRRIESGAIKADRIAVGRDSQPLHEGDVVQTRRNQSSSGVQNRQLWTVKRIDDAGLVLASTTDTGDLHRVDRRYAAENVQLGYATTVYGIQGETTDRSIVGPGVDAAGLYVGLTRGRADNRVVVVSPSVNAARNDLVDMMCRGTVEDSIDASRIAARFDLARSARQTAAIHHPERRQNSNTLQ